MRRRVSANQLRFEFTHSLEGLMGSLIAETPSGFRVNGQGQAYVWVRLKPEGTSSRIGPTYFEIERFVFDRRNSRSGRRLKTAIAVADRRTFAEAIQTGVVQGQRYNQWQKARKDACPPAGLDVALESQYDRLLRQIDPKVIRAQETVLRVARKFPRVMQEPEFYDDDFFLQDLVNCRAACLAVAIIEKLAKPFGRHEMSRHEGFNALLSLVGDGSQVKWVVQDGRAVPQDSGVLIRELRHWRLLFSSCGKSYRALNRTLDWLPARVSPDLVLQLPRVKIQRPIEERVEFLLIMSWALYDTDLQNPNVYQRAKKPEIQRAFRIVSCHLGQALSPGRTKDVAFFVQFLRDCNLEHQGNLCGLARKAVAYHEQLAHRRFLGQIRSLGTPSRSVGRPPVPLPEDERIRFLATLGDFALESQQMGHCVVTYADRALRGDCYLFHVSYSRSEATVEVNRQGRVVQSRGPYNGSNQATAWGERALAKWGRGFSARI